MLIWLVGDNIFCRRRNRRQAWSVGVSRPLVRCCRVTFASFTPFNLFVYLWIRFYLFDCFPDKNTRDLASAVVRSFDNLEFRELTNKSHGHQVYITQLSNFVPSRLTCKCISFESKT